MKKQKFFKLSMLTAAISCACIAHAAPSSPFTPIPLHLVTSAASKADPNIQLLLDNSGSMMYIPEVDNIYPHMEGARKACSNSLQNPSLVVRINTDGSCSYQTKDSRGNLVWTAPLKYGSGAIAYFKHCDVAGEGYAAKYATCAKPEAQRRNRIDALRDAMNIVLKDPANQNMRWGVSYLNYPNGSNAVDVPVGNNTAAKVLDSILKVQATGGTPNTQRYAKVMYDTYVIGDAIQYRCQKNFAIILSDGAPNGTTVPEGLAWYQSNWKGDGWDNDPTDPSNPDKTKAGGITYANWSVNNFNLASNTFGVNSYYGLYALSNILANKDLKTGGTDAEGQDWDSPDNKDWQKQTVTTSVVAFSLNIPYLQNGTQGAGAQYFSVSSPEDLTAAFKKLAQDAVNSGGSGYSTTTPSISGSATNLGTISLTLNLAQGVSTLQFVGLKRGASGQLEATVDDTRSINYGTLTDNSRESDRRVLVSHKHKAPKFLDINDTALWPNSGSATSQKYLDWVIRRSDKADNELSLRIRAKTANAPERMMGDVIVSSVLQVGGVKGSADTTATNNTKLYTPYLVTAANDGMVHIFKRNDTNEAQPYSLKLNWIPGAAKRESNQGPQTVWDAVQNTASDKYLSDSDGNAHTYLLNGGLTYRTTYNGQMFAVGALGQGGRGAYAFNIGGKDHTETSKTVGIDATQSTWTTSVPLWETANTNFPVMKADAAQNDKLGYTVGTPVIDRVATKRSNGNPVFTDDSNPIRYTAAIANGYFGSEELPSLYLYDALGVGMTYVVDGRNKPVSPKTPVKSGSNVGRLLAKIVVPDDDNAKGNVAITADNGTKIMGNGLSSPALIDLNDDGVVDIAYAGDLRGNMYRFDLRGDDVTKWAAQRIFKGSPNNPVTAAPAIFRKSATEVVVTFGTGRDFFTSDLTDKTDQYFYAVYDDLGMQRKPTCAADAANCTPEVSIDTRDTTLAKREISSALDGAGKEQYRFLTEPDATTSDMTNKQGWYIALPKGKGERVVTQPAVIDNAVFFTTRIYEQDTSQSALVCSKSNSSGYSWVMAANAVNGTAPSTKTTNFGRVVYDSAAGKVTGEVSGGNSGTSTGDTGGTGTGGGSDSGAGTGGTGTTGNKDKVKTVFYAGYRMSGIASSPVFSALNPALNNNKDGNFSSNEHGQSIDGADNNLHEKRPDPVSFCGSESSGDLIMSDSADGFQSKKLMNRECTPPTVRRLSWREIF